MPKSIVKKGMLFVSPIFYLSANSFDFQLNIPSGGRFIPQRVGGVGANLGHHYFKEAITIKVITAQFRQGINYSAYSRKDSIHIFIPPTIHTMGRKNKEV